MHAQLAAIGLVGNPHSLPPLPGWMVIVVATIGLLLIVRKAFGSRSQPDIVGELLELVIISAGASALITTPLVSSAVVQVKSFEKSLSTGTTYTIAAISVLLVIAAGVLYILTDSEWFTPLFAVVLLAAAVTQTWVTVLLQWVVDWPISIFWRLFLSVTEYVFNLKLS
jgi:hypothetical protein